MPPKSSKKKRRSRVSHQRKSTANALIVNKGFKIILFLLIASLILVSSFWLFIGKILSLNGFSSNLLISGSSLEQEKHSNFFIIFRPEKNNIKVISLDNEIKIAVIGDYGEYPLRSVVPLFEIENKDNQFKKSVFSFGLDFFVSDLISLKKDINFSTKSDLQKFFQQIVFDPGFKQDLNIGEKMQMMAMVNRLRQDQIEFVKVSSLDDWQTLVSKDLTEYQEPECKVAVINTTSQAGLATKIALIIKSLGASIIRVDDSSQLEDKTKLLINPESRDRCKFTLLSSQKMFPFTPQISQSDEATSVYRADLVILAGHDMDQLW